MTKKSDKDINKRIDNELKKKEMQKKYGAHFGGNSDLPPDIENEWLNYIENFEEQFEDAKQITVYNRLGEPAFKAENELSDIQLANELERLYKIMAEKYISLDVLSEVDDRDIYRFITEELFQQEIDDMDLPGTWNCFIYEDFHPNARLDIENAIDDFFISTMNKSKDINNDGYDLLYIDTENYMNSSGKKIQKHEIEKKINNYLDAYDHFEIIDNEIVDIVINEEESNAKATLKLHYKAWIEKRKNYNEHKGIANFKLTPSKYGGWSIYSIDMPGWIE
jgi:hypothetical protein